MTYSCDLIVASERAEWRLSQGKLGILPAQGALVRWVVPHADLMARALEIADEIAAHPPLASRLTKESLNQGMDMPHLADSALMDLYRFAALETTEDKKESHDAWRERRKAKIKGQ